MNLNLACSANGSDRELCWSK